MAVDPGTPRSTIIGNAEDTLDADGNGSAIALLKELIRIGNPANNLSVNITTDATTLVKTGAGVAKRLVVNTAGVTSSIVLYDSLTGSGTKLGTFSTLAQGSIILDIPFATGLTAVTTGGTPADITISYQ